jgi:hypothetical protein
LVLNDKKLYRFKVKRIYKIILALMPLIGIHLYIEKQELVLFLFIVPLIIILFYFIFNNVFVRKDGLVFFRVIIVKWSSIKSFKKVDQNMYLLRLKKFPYIMQINYSDDYDELIKRIKSNAEV